MAYGRTFTSSVEEWGAALLAGFLNEKRRRTRSPCQWLNPMNSGIAFSVNLGEFE
jgi:hypothetical protein